MTSGWSILYQTTAKRERELRSVEIVLEILALGPGMDAKEVEVRHQVKHYW